MDPIASPPEPPATAASAAPAPKRRCNADYRWTEPKVLAFLAALAESGRVADAARAVGMSRNSAYRFRARMGSARFDAAFDGARRTGIRARAAASMARVAAERSPWEGLGIAEMTARERAREFVAQGDAPPPQGDTRDAQGGTRALKGDASAAQGDALSHKVTKDSPGPCNIRSMSPELARRAGFVR